MALWVSSPYNKHNIGIDTSLSQLDIGVRPTNEFFSLPNDDPGIKEAIKRIKKLKPTRVLIEATGRLETAFAVAAFKASLPIVICNPGANRCLYHCSLW